jgi:ferric-dicitrate binding protein FerR (iron transport regulator)
MNDKSDEELTAGLMRIAGPRADVPADVESRVYERVLDEWTDENQQAAGKNAYKTVERSWKWGLTRKRLMQWVAPILVAASVAFVMINFSATETVAVPAIGSVARLVGFESDDSLVGGEQIYPGVTLSTGEGQGVSVLLAREESLRLDENTRLQVDGKNQFKLLEGRVYADTGQFMYRNGGLSIVAGMATVTDVGTQFSIAFDGSLLDVGVREGRVDIGSPAGDAVAIAGERIKFDETGVLSSEELRPNDVYWQWASSLAPIYDTNNRSLMDFLNWTARETGLQLVFESDELRMAAMRTDLHGAISDLRPAEAIDAVMATTNFRYRIESGTIYIGR